MASKEVDLDSNGAIDIQFGGTNATTAGGARASLGLGNVDNTSDANKPVSIATQASIDSQKPSAEIDYDQGGAGSVVRTVESKLQDSVSVDDFSDIDAAVAYCIANSTTLHWPAGDYPTTDDAAGNIALLHTIRHSGDGAILRGGIRFYLDPKEGQSNTLYVDAASVIVNADGLTPATAALTFQDTFDFADNYANPMLNGNWSIVADAGTYPITSGQHVFSAPSKNRVIIRGPVAGHPNVPTCIIDGGGDGAAFDHGLTGSGANVDFEFRDMKAIGFTQLSGNQRVGFVGDQESSMLTTNLHTLDCSWAGIYAFSSLRARISGGILDAGAAGAYCYIANETQCTLGSGSTSTATAPIMKNALSAGIFWSRGAQGHIDFCNIEDCNSGILFGQNSRADTVGNDFKRNVVGIEANSGSWYGEGGAPNIFNDGTADANATNIINHAYSGDSVELGESASITRRSVDRTPATISGITTGEIATLGTIQANRMQAAGNAARIEVWGTYTVTVASSITINIGAASLVLEVPGAATGVLFHVDAMLLEKGGSPVIVGTLTHDLALPSMGFESTGIDIAIDQAVTVDGTLTGAGDTLSTLRTDMYYVG